MTVNCGKTTQGIELISAARLSYAKKLPCITVGWVYHRKWEF